MKFKIVTISLITLLLFACEEKDKKVVPKEVIKEEPIIVEFGFTYNDYLVVQDTVQSGDTFSKLLEENNIGTFKVHDVTEMVKDSFNLRDIRIGKPFTLLKSKKAPHQLQVFIYQKDNIHYSVVDFRDTVVVAYNKQKPITIKRRTIATSISGSLSETLSKNGVDASMANNLAKIYEYSIDFFKIQKDDKFAVTFYEKYINDSIYAGVERMESSFFEHKGKKIYAFPYKLDSLSKKVDYYDEEGKGLKTMF
ncbi:MAG TPA: M23 family peptidase, partial [Flavobacterium sp.]|nr:M23 family peptidase [Flavobacterium sp.]